MVGRIKSGCRIGLLGGRYPTGTTLLSSCPTNSHTSSLHPQMLTLAYKQKEERRKTDKQAEILIYKSKFKGIAYWKGIALSKPLCFNSGRNFHNEMRSHKAGKNGYTVTPIPMVPDKP